MDTCIRNSMDSLSNWSLPEKTILHGGLLVLLGFLLFCAVSVTRVDQVGSKDMFISYAAMSMVHAVPKK